MSKEYDLYLEQHKNAVRQALYWIMDNLPTLIPEENQLELVWLPRYTQFVNMKK